MRIYLSCIFVFIVIAVAIMQETALSQSNSVVIKKIDANKPSVFISFDSNVTSFEQCSRKEQDSYRLRLYNNTSVPINIDAGYGADEPVIMVKGSNRENYKALPKAAKIRVCYQAESMITYESKAEKGSLTTEIPVEREVPKVDFYCSCKSQMSADRAFNNKGLWIPSGSYVLFDVPRKYLSKELKIYTLFNYEWEFENTDLSYNEPHHQVFFYSSDIPKSSSK
jgi:hypothetical protein